MHLVFNICVKEVISRCFMPTRNNLRYGFLVSPNARQQKISCSNVNGKKVRPCLLLCFVGSKDSTCLTVSLFLVKVVLPRVKVVTIFVKIDSICCESCHCFLWKSLLLLWKFSLFLAKVVRSKRWHWVNRVSEQVSVGYVPREFQVICEIPPENAFGFQYLCERGHF